MRKTLSNSIKPGLKPELVEGTPSINSAETEQNKHSGYRHLSVPQESTALPLKPGFHIVVSVVSVVRKKFIGQIEFILSRTKSCICYFFCIEHLYGRFP